MTSRKVNAAVAAAKDTKFDPDFDSPAALPPPSPPSHLQPPPPPISRKARNDKGTLKTALQRPTHVNKWYSITPERWAGMSHPIQIRHSHVARIMKESGVLTHDICQLCTDRGWECWKYASTSIDRVGDACARCRALGKVCSSAVSFIIQFI
jgi:hypothetical protein